MTDLRTPADAARERAEQRFRVSEQRRTDAEKVMADLEAAKSAERDKTVRLRALRLAKEEQDRVARETPVAARAAAKPKARRAKSSA